MTVEFFPKFQFWPAWLAVVVHTNSSWSESLVCSPLFSLSVSVVANLVEQDLKPARLSIYTAPCELGRARQFSVGPTRISALFFWWLKYYHHHKQKWWLRLLKLRCEGTFQNFLTEWMRLNFLWVMALDSDLINLSDVWGQSNCGNIFTEVSQLHVTYTWPSWQPWGGMRDHSWVCLCLLFQGMLA